MSILTIFVSIWLISLWVYVRRGKSVIRALVIGVGLQTLVAALMWGGPLSSGALFLLLPNRAPAADSSELPESYTPLHKGYVDLSSGLYVREDEDIVLSGSPSFVWRRAYLSRDRGARHMGIGTTHNAEWYLMGHVRDLQHVQLVQEDGARITFDRTSRGWSYANAMFVHTESATDFYGARLGWVGQRWALRFRNGALAMFKSCDTPDNPCSLISVRDPQNRIVRLIRDDGGVLRAIEAGTERLTFDYDDRKRVVRVARGSDEVTYSYDDRGRLVRATAGAVIRSFQYGPRDEMIAIEEPSRIVENTYDSELRVIRQVVRRAGHPDDVLSFAYTIHDGKIAETTVTQYDGSRTTYRWNDKRRHDLEIHEGDGQSVMVQYARPDGVFTQSLTVSCTRDGRAVSETVEVWPGEESRVKNEVIERICSG
jgi:YD repeat-containing protein